MQFRDKHPTNEFKSICVFSVLLYLSIEIVKKIQVKNPMLKIVFNEAKTSSALLQMRTERTEVMDQVRVYLISQDVTEAGGAVPGQRREKNH